MSNFRDADSPLVWFRHFVETRGDQTYMVQPLPGGELLTLTWAEVDDRARRMAAHLRSLDLPALSQIALISKNCHEWIIADLAIWMAGHVSVPLYPTLAPETVNAIMEHSEAKLAFLGRLDEWDSMKAGLPKGIPGIAFTLAPDDVRANYPLFQDDIVAKTDPLPLDQIDRRDPDTMATIIYTSGSTGMPKGVMHSFRTIAAAARGAREQIGIGDDERVLSYLPLAHVAERSVVELNSLFNGVEVYFADSLETFLDDLRRARPTVFFSVPRLWIRFRLGVLEKMPEKKLNRLLKIPFLGKKVKKKILTQLGLEHVRFAATGAAPLPADVIHWYRNLGLELLEVYGMSENFGYSHANAPGRTKVGTVGECNPFVEHRIAENGEIQIKSATTMLGYFKEPEKTADTMDGEWLKTGDRGEIDSEGRLKITGRTKELFKTAKGKYVAPAPIENKLAVNPHIEACCVAGADYPQPHGMVMLSEDGAKHRGEAALEAELEALLKAVNVQLDPHEHLQFLVVVKDQWDVDNGFLTPTMKIKRDVIEKAYQAQLDGWYASRKAVIWQ